MRVEWLILADYAQAIGNKVYIMGGGWDRLTVNSGFPVQQSVGIASSVIVPWNETNQETTLEIEVLTEDGVSIAKVEAKFNVGRPANLTEGQDQRAQLALNVPLSFKEPGTYVIVAKLQGQEEEEKTVFKVVPGPMLAMKQRFSKTEPSQDGGNGGEEG